MKIPLSPMDYYFLRPGLYSMRFLFDFESRLVVEDLRQALLKIKDVIPVAFSQIVREGDEVFLQTGFEIPLREIHFSKEPNLEDEAVLDSLVDEIRNQEGESLIRISLAQTPSRTFMGVGFSHVLGDGTSFFHLMKEFARAARGLSSERKSVDDRHLVPVNEATGDFQEEFFKDTGYTIVMPAEVVTESAKIFFASSDLEAQRREARRQGLAVTNHDLVMAQLMKRYHPHFANQQGKALIRCPVDYRGVMDLPPGFFGNAILDARAEFSAQEVEKTSCAQIAVKIRSAIRAVDAAAVRRALGRLVEFRKKNGIKAFQHVGCPGLVVSNLSKAPLDELDFGSGAPKRFYPVGMFRRLALIRSTEKGEEVQLTFPTKRSDYMPNKSEK